MPAKKFMSQRDRPDDVEPIALSAMSRMGVGGDGQLYWDGKPVETQSRLKLSPFQTLVAIVTFASLFITAVNGFSDLTSKIPDTPRVFAACEIEATKIYPDHSGSNFQGHFQDWEDALELCMEGHGYKMWNSCPSVADCYEPRSLMSRWNALFIKNPVP